MRRSSRVLAAVGVLVGVGCFSPVGEPDYWRFARPHTGDAGWEDLGADAGGGDVAWPRGCPQVDCNSYGDVEDVGGLLAQLATLSWTTIARPTSVCLPASNDFHVTRTVNISASDIPRPPLCSTPGSCAGLTFALSDGAEGVKCLDDFCTTLMLTGAHFRLRLVVFDQYPNVPRYVPIAQVLPTCQSPCAADELRCSAHHTCWRDSVEFCRFCLDYPQEECACLGKFEGDTCLFYLSNDLTCAGACTDGRCVLADGQPNCPTL